MEFCTVPIGFSPSENYNWDALKNLGGDAPTRDAGTWQNHCPHTSAFLSQEMFMVASDVLIADSEVLC